MSDKEFDSTQITTTFTLCYFFTMISPLTCIIPGTTMQICLSSYSEHN